MPMYDVKNINAGDFINLKMLFFVESITFGIGHKTYKITGVIKNPSYDEIRINLTLTKSQLENLIIP